MIKRILTGLVILILAGGILFGNDEPPQIAYRLLDGYVREKEENGKSNIGSIVTMSVGGVAIAAGVFMWFQGDTISTWFTEDETPWDDSVKYGICGGLVLGGGITTGIGTALLFRKPVDYRSEYPDVFNETDPILQEAMAVSTLFDLSEEGKRSRIISSSTSLAVPVLTTGITIAANLASDKEWYEDVVTVNSSTVWSIVSALTGFFQKSDEERLYDKYHAAKDALYVSTNR